MGFLGEAAEADGGNDVDTSAEDTTQTVDTSAQESTISTQDTPVADQKTERVALPSRRERAAQRNNEVTEQLKTLQKTIGESQTKFEARLSEMANENARLRGNYEALQPFVQRQQAPAGPPPKSPDEIRREARKALDAGDYDTWERQYTDSIVSQVRGLIPQQQAQQQGPSPIVQAMLMQYPEVVKRGDQGIQLAIAEDNRLAALGHQASPERFQKAFELASQALGAPAKPAYSQSSRGALAGVPRARDNASSQGSGEQGVTLTAYEMSVAEKCGMSKAEYAKYVAEMDPKRVTG